MDSIVQIDQHDGQGTDTGDEPPYVPPRRAQPGWLARHVRLLAVLDATAAATATFLAKLLLFGFGPANLPVRSWEIPYVAVAFASVPTWLIVMTTSRCYDLGPLGDNQSEIRRVISAAAHFVAVIAVAYYLVRIEALGRDFLVAIVPLATALTLAFRLAARRLLRIQRLRGIAVRKTLLVGSRAAVMRLLDHLADHPGSGIEPVAALVPGRDRNLPFGVWEIPVVGKPNEVAAGLINTDADLLVIAGGYEPGQLRRLTWALEGTGVDVMVAPTGNRPTGLDLDVRPVAGLPLLYVNGGMSDARE